MKEYVISGLLLLSISSASWANGSGLLESQGYSCVIMEVYFLMDTGSLDGGLEGGDYRKGKTFIIDRGTGRAIGAIKNYSDDYGDFQPTVLDRGDGTQYFKALTLYGINFPAVELLVVQEFAESKQKPFMFTQNGQVTTGVCENI